MASVTLAINSGAPPYTISVKKSGDNTERYQNYSGSTLTFNAVADGSAYTYDIRVTDAQGCVDTKQIAFSCPGTSGNITYNCTNNNITVSGTLTGAPSVTIILRKDGVQVDSVDNMAVINGAYTKQFSLYGNGSYTAYVFQPGNDPNNYTIPAVNVNCSLPSCTPVSGLTATASAQTVAPGGSTTLNVSGTGLLTGTAYVWSLNGTQIATTKSPTVTLPTTAGGYVYTVTATNTDGQTGTCTASATITVTVQTTPSSNVTLTCTGSTLRAVGTLSGSTSSGIAFSVRKNGVEVTSREQTTGPAFDQSWDISGYGSGTYTVYLFQRGTDSNNLTSDPATCSSGCANPISNLVATTSASPVSPNASITLNVSGTGLLSGTTYSWSGNGFSSTQKNPTLNAPSTAGSYTYTVTASNGAGCTATAQVLIVVQTPTCQNWTDTGSTRCNSCVNEKQEQCEDGTTRWVAGGNTCASNPSCSTALTFDISCSGISITGNLAGASSVSASLRKGANNAGSEVAKLFDNRSGSDLGYSTTFSTIPWGDGTYYLYVWSPAVDSNNQSSGPNTVTCSTPCVVSSWTNTGETECQSCVSKIRQISNCGTYQWINGGNACAGVSGCSGGGDPSISINLTCTSSAVTVTGSLSYPGYTQVGAILQKDNADTGGDQLLNLTNNSASFTFYGNGCGTYRVRMWVPGTDVNVTQRYSNAITTDSGCCGSTCTDSTWSDTGNTQCLSGVIWKEQVSNCGNTQTVNTGSPCPTCPDPAPNTNAVINGSTSTTPGGTIQFSFDDLNAGGGRFAWSMNPSSGFSVNGGFNVGSAGANITFNVAGTYTMSSTYTNCAGAVTKTKTIVVGTSCSAPTFLVSTSNPVCSNGSLSNGIVFVNSISNGNRIKVLAGSSYSENNCNVGGTDLSGSSYQQELAPPAANSSQNYTVRVWQASQCSCFTDYTFGITSPACSGCTNPVAPVLSASQVVACPTDGLTVTASNVVAGTTLQWSDGTTNTDTTHTFTKGANDISNVFVTAVNSCGSTPSNIVTLKWRAPLPPIINANPSANRVLGQQVTLTANGYEDDPDQSYVWSNGQVGRSITVTVTAASQSFRCKIQYNEGCVSEWSNWYTIQVENCNQNSTPPAYNFTAAGQSICYKYVGGIRPYYVILSEASRADGSISVYLNGTLATTLNKFGAAQSKTLVTSTLTNNTDILVVCNSYYPNSGVANPMLVLTSSAS